MDIKLYFYNFFFQAEDCIRYLYVTGVQTCALPILAYLALTASDLWPGKGWNFVFGEANLRQRTGVWSIYRNGDPGEDFTLYLRRTLGTASHELGHVLTIHHCTAFRCLMNGSNHQEERDARPLCLCPVCLRKLCWNLWVEPVPYLTKMKAFCQ